VHKKNFFSKKNFHTQEGIKQA